MKRRKRRKFRGASDIPTRVKVGGGLTATMAGESEPKREHAREKKIH